MAEGYCFDTSSLVHAWVRTYPPESFPGVWSKLDEAIDKGLILSPEDVRQELTHPDGLRDWASTHDSMFRELDAEVQISLRDVVSFIKKRLKKQGLKMMPKDLKADPIVVALARVTKRTVVVQETRRGQQGRPKIPDLCDEFNVRCINLVEFIQDQKWKFW